MEETHFKMSFLRKITYR